VTRRKATIINVDLTTMLATVLWSDTSLVVADSEVLHLTTGPDEFGDIPVVVRSDLGKAYEHNDGEVGDMTDWDELTDLPDIPWLPGGHNPLSGDLAYVDIVADSPMIIGVSKIPVVEIVVPETTPATYTVLAGDTLPSIGMKFSIPWQIIAQWNSIVDPFIVTTGKVLLLTAPPPVIPPLAAVQVPSAASTAPGVQFSTKSTIFVPVNGPVVRINLVAGQAVVVTLSVKLVTTTAGVGHGAFASFTMTGPGTNLSSTDVVATESRGVETGAATWSTASRSTKQIAGTGGQYIFTAVYKTSLASSPAIFVNSYLLVQP
jgi:LysM repeat protein